MPTKPDATSGVPVRVALSNATPDDKLETLQAVLFDRNGAVVAQTQLKVSREGGQLMAQGALKAALKAASFAGACGKLLPLFNLPGVNASRVLVYGAGEGKVLAAKGESLTVDQPIIEFA